MGRILFRKDHGYAEGGITTDVYSCDQWQIMPTEHGFRIATEMKEVASNDWLDEDGDDEFVPDKPCFKAFEDEIEFVYKGEELVVLRNIHIGSSDQHDLDLCIREE